MGDVNLQVSKELIVPLIESKIAAAIAAEMGDPAAIIESLIKRQLSVKVNDDGKANEYRSDTPFLVWVMQGHLKRIVNRGVEAWVTANQNRLEGLVKKALDKNATGFAKSLVDALAANTVNNIKVDVVANVSVPRPREY